MPKTKKKARQSSLARLIVLGLVGLTSLIYVLVSGSDFRLFDAKGLIAQEQLNLMVISAVVLLAMVIPAMILAFYTAWKYRESNALATYAPDKRHSKFLDISMWAVPSAFMLALALIMWPATHRLAPQKTIAADVKPMTIQVVALRWKWLFIYPEQKIATVNFVQIPTNTPVKFDLTADEAPMSSFWIPNLGGMLYAMTGHSNRLNLIADTPGDYPGSSAEINGEGFAGMKFTARASSRAEFDDWVEDVKWSQAVLNAGTYEKLVKPSEDNPSVFYSEVDSGLYDKVLMKYAPGQAHSHSQNMNTQVHH